KRSASRSSNSPHSTRSSGWTRSASFTGGGGGGDLRDGISQRPPWARPGDSGEGGAVMEITTRPYSGAADRDAVLDLLRVCRAASRERNWPNVAQLRVS